MAFLALREVTPLSLFVLSISDRNDDDRETISKSRQKMMEFAREDFSNSTLLTFFLRTYGLLRQVISYTSSELDRARREDV